MLGPLHRWLSHQTTLARGIPGNQVRPIGGGKWVLMVSPFSDGGADTHSNTAKLMDFVPCLTCGDYDILSAALFVWPKLLLPHTITVFRGIFILFW
ncbi:hypothetical protein BC826DRAFT_7042 [Russula brevipes]|nr:hypothetical protein BC826DRAFT_7042 [Russula brevipes]